MRPELHHPSGSAAERWKRVIRTQVSNSVPYSSRRPAIDVVNSDSVVVCTCHPVVITCTAVIIPELSIITN
jgi:hypothetical protein